MLINWIFGSKAKSRWIWTLSGAVAAILTSANAAPGLNEVCPTCALAAAQQASADLQPQANLVPTFGTLTQLGYQVAPLTNPNRPFFATPDIPLNPNIPVWNGEGRPPGAMLDSDFDPSFKAPFYDSSLGGLFNTELAPWNLFLPPDVARAWYGPIVTMPSSPALALAQGTQPL